MTFDEKVVTHTPPAAAYLYLSDMSNAPSWDPGIARVEQLTPGPVGVGTRFRLVLRMLGMKSTLDSHVEVYEPERRVIFLGRGMLAKVTDTVLVTPYRGGSRVRWIAEIRLTGPLRIFGPLLRLFYQPNVTRAVANLKRALDRLTPSQMQPDVPRHIAREDAREPSVDRPEMHPGAVIPSPRPDLGAGAHHN